MEQNLAAAFNDSDAKSPILLLLAQAIDSKKIIADFLRTTGLAQCAVNYFALFKGTEEHVEAMIQ